MNTILVEEKMHLMQQYQNWKHARDQFLKQKCKVQRLKKGYLNTKFYYSILRARINANRIFVIIHKDVKHTIEMDGIIKAFIEYYVQVLEPKQRT